MTISHKWNGFTIVELIVVITCIALLVTVGVVGWSSVTTAARDSARETDLNQWASRFDLYRTRFVVDPAMPTADGAAGSTTMCLGSFTSYNNKCGQYNSGTTGQFYDATLSSAMITESNKVGNAITNSGPAIKNMLIGPVVYLTQTTVGSNVNVTAQFINFFEGSCPSGTTNINSSLPSSLSQVLSGTGANACAKTQQFTYGP